MAKSLFNSYPHRHRKRYKHRYSHRNNDILGLTGAEKEIFKFASDLIHIIAIIIIFTCKETYKLIIYINKRIDNYFCLEKTGYELDEILDFVYDITPRQFEVLICELFREQGYSAKLTPPSCDYGRDVILDGNIFVECKHYSSNNYVGREICQKLLGSIQMFNAKRGIIITTGTYHKNAREVAARVNNLKLMDINDIKKMILGLETNQINKVMSRTLNAS